MECERDVIITIDHKRDSGINDTTLMAKDTTASWKLETYGQISSGS